MTAPGGAHWAYKSTTWPIRGRRAAIASSSPKRRPLTSFLRGEAPGVSELNFLCSPPDLKRDEDSDDERLSLYHAAPQPATPSTHRLLEFQISSIQSQRRRITPVRDGREEQAGPHGLAGLQPQRPAHVLLLPTRQVRTVVSRRDSHPAPPSSSRPPSRPPIPPSPVARRHAALDTTRITSTRRWWR